MARGGRKKKGGKNKERRRAKAKGPKQAASADKYELYQRAVQDPQDDVKFARRVFKNVYERVPRLLREDFCGAAATACAWVAAHPENRAIGIDIDPEPLDWGREHNLTKLGMEELKRLELVQADVLEPHPEKVEVIVAFNFSYFCFKERSVLKRYFARTREALQDEGVLVLDAYGGADAQRTLEEERDCEGFDYVWDQDVFDPVHHNAINYIHFAFRDGSRMRKAFRYDWRLWSLPELRDLLLEVGYSDVQVYWEGTDSETGEGNGVYYAADKADDDPAWVSYIVATR